MQPSVRNAFIQFNEPLESRVHFMYLDVKSLVSTGVGNLLDADSPEHFGTNPQPLPAIFTLNWFDKASGLAASHADILSEYQTVKFSGTAQSTLAVKESITHLRVDDSSIDSLCKNTLNRFEQDLRHRPDFSDLDNWPADGQLGLFSMAWALGPAFKFPLFQAAAKAKQWLTMARESHMDETGNSGLVPRNVRNGLLFTIAGWMAAPPVGDFSVLVFDPAQKLDANMRSGNFPVPLNLSIGVQTALEFLGFNPNGLDGIFGPNTRTALTSYQSANGLTKTPAAKTVADVPAATINRMADQLDADKIEHFP
ncbi:peptidoglycan-binding protein [Streptomyces sp. NPDC096032]|uniref:peptidoglycan-binding domain-containing protein n=1 Tax=Streptomyces sp. NPDC096032 TaxID=3366070 RepID=UPI0038049D95